MEIAFEVDQLVDDDKSHRCLSLKGGYSCEGNFSNCQQLKWREGRHQLLGAVKRVSENMRPTLQGPFFATAIQFRADSAATFSSRQNMAHVTLNCIMEVYFHRGLPLPVASV